MLSGLSARSKGQKRRKPLGPGDANKIRVGTRYWCSVTMTIVGTSIIIEKRRNKMYL
jgi:hypothetical protein